MAKANKLIYTKPSPSLDNTSDNILWDLGKATKRGVKKCPNCGFTNGTRCYMCKNPLCNIILKDIDKHKVHIDSIKLLTGTGKQIYSVRIKDKGPDQRGFVQLPELPFYENDKNFLSEVALCFVNSCQRLFDDSILKCHEDFDNSNGFCIHIESALKSLSVAHAIDFKHDLINNLKASDNVKKKLCSLAKSTEGPLVQRISKNVMAIKCFVNSTHPLGYLHFTLNLKRNAKNEDEIESFHCVCNAKADGTSEKCLHYYACVCALASDHKLMQKYSVFVQNEFDQLISYDLNMLMDEHIHKQHMYPVENIHIKILQPDMLRKAEHNKKRSKSNRRTNVQGAKIRKVEEKESIQIIANEIIRTADSHNNNINNNQSTRVYDGLSFQEWFASAIERINCSSLTYDSVFISGNDLEHGFQNSAGLFEQSLLFHIPDRFFDLFKDRICCVTKKYQPDEIKTNIRNVPPGSFITVTFAIVELTQVQQLFTANIIQLTTINLIVNNQRPFKIDWTAGIYKQTNFGELQLSYTKSANNSI